MCGVLGVFCYSPNSLGTRQDEFDRALGSMRTRGPDGLGVWFSEDRRLALGHRRLSILDLSENGSQPMWDPSKRYVISYNGEIYNFRGLRQELVQAGYQLKSTSDTE